jgi:hypothetical protein
MSRKPRAWLLAQDTAYHVMSRGHNREALLRSDDDKRQLLALLARYKARFGFALFHYCLITTHPD